MKSIQGIFFAAVVGSTLFLQHAQAREHPLQYYSDPSCKGLHRDEHPESCKIPYEPVFNNILNDTWTTDEKLLFSVLWKGSYSEPYSRTKGHAGLDIVSAEGTPVYAIESGIVHSVGTRGGFGNTIVIKHSTGNETIFSNYAHLEKMIVIEGETVSAGKQIGTIGHSGFTMGRYGNHLEFQITKEKSYSHPYGYGNCQSGYWTAVESGTCTSLLEKHTINPIELYRGPQKQKKIQATVKTTPPSIITPTDHLQIPDKKTTIYSSQQTKKTSGSTANSIANSIRGLHRPTTNSIIGKNSQSNSSPTDKNFSIHVEMPQQAKVGTFSTLHFSVFKHESPYSGVLPNEIKITQDGQELLSFFQENWSLVFGGKKDIIFKSKKTGTSHIQITSANQLIREGEMSIINSD